MTERELIETIRRMLKDKHGIENAEIKIHETDDARKDLFVRVTWDDDL